LNSLTQPGGVPQATLLVDPGESSSKTTAKTDPHVQRVSVLFPLPPVDCLGCGTFLNRAKQEAKNSILV